MNETITLAHGSGGRQTNELIGSLFKKYFDNDLLTAEHEGFSNNKPSEVYFSGKKMK